MLLRGSALILVFGTVGRAWGAPPVSPSMSSPPGSAAAAAASAGSPALQPPAPGSPSARVFEEAKAHFDSGNAHYAAGRYEDAIRDFQAGYGLVPRPNFLVNLGQAFRKLGDLARAKEAYVAYVRALPENSALRDQALQVLAEIEVQIQDEKGGSSGAGPGPAVLEARLPEPPPLPPAPAPSVVSPPPPPPVNHAARWTGVGLGVIGIGALATGVLFELRAKDASDALTALDRQQQPYDPVRAKQGRDDEKIGVGFLIGGGVALAVGAALYLFADGAPGASSDTRLSLGPSGVGLRF